MLLRIRGRSRRCSDRPHQRSSPAEGERVQAGVTDTAGSMTHRNTSRSRQLRQWSTRAGLRASISCRVDCQNCRGLSTPVRISRDFATDAESASVEATQATQNHPFFASTTQGFTFRRLIFPDAARPVQSFAAINLACRLLIALTTTASCSS